MLDTNQTEAALSTADTTVVIAGPGSGKTTTLVGRVEALVARGDSPERLILLTFTNAGAHEIATRLKAKGITVGYAGTLHGYCFRLLQEYGTLLGYRRGRAVSLIHPDDTRQMVKAIADRLKVKLSVKALLEDTGGDNDSRNLVLKEYAHQLKRNNMIDYDGLLAAAQRILEMLLPEIINDLAIDEVLIDEAQDSGIQDWLIYSALPGRKFIVGDPDQSIYAFRGGEPSLLVGAAETRLSKVVTLSQNYRSRASICDVANKLIQHNVNRVGKTMFPNTIQSGTVEAIGYDDDAAEINGTLRRIFGIQAIPDMPSVSIVVLARTNAVAASMRQALSASGVKLEESRSSLPMPPDWQQCLMLLNLLLNPDNDLLMEKFIRFRDASQLDAIRKRALHNGTSLAAAMGFQKIVDVALDKIPEALSAMGISLVSVELVKERMAVLPQENPPLPDLVADLWKHDEWNRDQPDTSAVYCGTVHGFKGREADVVFVIGMEEGEFPKIRKDDGLSAMEEERRLAFVAFTRARHTLITSYCATRKNQWSGRSKQAAPSRFLSEGGLL